jgi:hypothetical protein
MQVSAGTSRRECDLNVAALLQSAAALDADAAVPDADRGKPETLTPHTEPIPGCSL